MLPRNARPSKSNLNKNLRFPLARGVINYEGSTTPRTRALGPESPSFFIFFFISPSGSIILARFLLFLVVRPAPSVALSNVLYRPFDRPIYCFLNFPTLLKGHVSLSVPFLWPRLSSPSSLPSPSLLRFARSFLSAYSSKPSFPSPTDQPRGATFGAKSLPFPRRLSPAVCLPSLPRSPSTREAQLPIVVFPEFPPFFRPSKLWEKRQNG